jgi:hypothetical protein
MFERILYIVSEKQEEKSFVMDLARKHDSTVLLSGIMAAECRQQMHTEGQTRRNVLRENQERKCWLDLYSLEEEFKKGGIKSSVIAQEGNIDSIQLLASSTHCDLIVLATSNLADQDYRLPEELLPNLPCPIVLANAP